MGLRGLVDSPLDQSENLQLLSRIERQLDLTDENVSDTEVSTFDTFDHWESTTTDLWTLVLDVVFAPLSIRIRAAELLSAICIGTNGEDTGELVVRVDATDVHKLRAIVSSTCQTLEELDATDVHQATQLFAWLGFLERVLLATQSDVCAQVFHNSMYAGMLTKMLRLLSVCSTKVFAAITVCLALFHSHERECGRTVLVGEVLHDMKDGREHLGGALLHVINSCGCPCPKERVVHLWNSVQFFGDILADEIASALVFVNDLKVLIDLVIRECTDLPQEDPTRLRYLELLERILGSPLYLQAQMYRKRDLWTLLESLLGAGAEEDSLMAKDVTNKIKQILVRYVDLLD
ncbi:hypothetical protein JM18_005263 [Phytophthora kernoviae]|uniref:SPIN90/Ldb17 leucine-rich domain-containing protein n=2 Tax=Phytophthora kernoviae TaxID=325452 RepID=A0A8T0LYM1_9STRA|nr:hypothetical protein G195_006679 [Phytophthora kernoviae 00238/432]KAG2523077.1 hypothetical protein JM16_004837 [Phytophthora kernoviae]KAG2524752.1 hypothetical protein JM18_005263 [Phytophthora kernoviae]